MGRNRAEAGDGAVVVGGAMVAGEPGDWRVPARYLSYLLELSDEVGPITLFASLASPKVGQAIQRSRVPDERIRVEPIRIKQSRTRAAKLLRANALAERLARAVAERPRVVHFFPKAGGALGVAALRAASRVCVTHMSSDWIAHTRSRPGFTLPQTVWWQAAEALVVRVSDAVLFRSAAHRRRLEASVRGRVEDAEEFLATTAPPSHRPTVREVDDEAPFELLYVGSLVRKKGLEELMEAAGRLAREGWAFRITLAGAPGGDHDAEEFRRGLPRWLEEAATRHGVAERVRPLGYLDDPERLGELYAASDALVLPSWSEGFPRVVDEALSWGLPILTTPVGGIPDVLTHGETALLVPPRAPEALARGLDELLGSVDRRRALAEAGRRLYAQRVGEGAARQHARLLRTFG